MDYATSFKKEKKFITMVLLFWVKHYVAEACQLGSCYRTARPTGSGRGKDMANITGHQGRDRSVTLQEEGKENRRPVRPAGIQRGRKRRGINDLDSDSTVQEEESEDEFCLSSR